MSNGMNNEQSAKRLQLTFNFKSRDQWISAYFCLGLGCDTPIIEAVYHRPRSFHEIFEELDPVKLWKPVMPELTTSRHFGETKVMIDWWNRFKELVPPKLIHMFGPDSVFSNPSHWFGCWKGCQSTNYLGVVHYPQVVRIGAGGDQYFMTCGMGGGLSLSDFDLDTELILHSHAVQTHLVEAQFRFDRSEEASGNCVMIFSQRKRRALPIKPGVQPVTDVRVAGNNPMHFLWASIWRRFDFTTACLLLESPNVEPLAHVDHKTPKKNDD